MKPDNLVLRPNCLLTRSPLVFISGPRSLFSPQKMGADLQDFVLAHGYQIESMWLPFRSASNRKIFIERWFQKNKSRSFHFFVASETWIEFKQILEANFHPYSTITIINLNSETPRSQLENVELFNFESLPTSSPVLYSFHKLFCAALGYKALPYSDTLLTKDLSLYDRFLDHCIHLAENEYKDLTSRM